MVTLQTADAVCKLVLFPVLTPPEWFDARLPNEGTFDERGPDLTDKCRQALRIKRSGMMPVRCRTKRQALIRYTPEACAYVNAKLNEWSGVGFDDEPNYSDVIGEEPGWGLITGMLLQSPCRRFRVVAIWGLDDWELVSNPLAPGVDFIASGHIDVAGWQCANRRTSSGGEMAPILLHKIRNGCWPLDGEDMDRDATVNQQRLSLKSDIESAISEAHDFTGIAPERQSIHREFWFGKAQSLTGDYLAIGGTL